MPLEQLQKLFEEIGQTAERLSRLRREGEATLGGRVARSESVHSVADLYAQLGQGQAALAIKPIERLTQQLEKLNERLASQEKRAEAEGGGGPSFWRRLQPRHWMDPLLRFSNYVAGQQAAGQSVDPLTYRLAWASRFLYSFSTGRVVTPSGRAIPWRRALAARLRGRRWTRPIRRALLAPDIAMRRARLAWTAAQGGGRALGAVRAAASAAGVAGRLAAAGAAGAGAAGAGASGAGAAGAGAAGATGLGAASALGVAAGAVTGFAAAVIGGTMALGKFVGAVRESASASLESYRQYAEMAPAMAAVLSQKDVFDMQERARRGQMLAPMAQAELASYKQWTEGTRNIEILGSNTWSLIQIGFMNGVQKLLGPLEQLAEAINRWIGIEEEKRGVKSPLEHPLLKAFELMRKGQAEFTMGQDFYHWPRQKPPKPINMGPGE